MLSHWLDDQPQVFLVRFFLDARQPSNPSVILFSPPPRSSRNFDLMAENQIAQWLQQGGDDALQNKGKALGGDRHKDDANSLCIGNDYTHSKILADNNIKPESIKRPIKMDKDWEQLKQKIQQAYYENNNDKILSFLEYANNELTRIIRKGHPKFGSTI
jgi:hypothetical protein